MGLTLVGKLGRRGRGGMGIGKQGKVQGARQAVSRWGMRIQLAHVPMPIMTQLTHGPSQASALLHTLLPQQHTPHLLLFLLHAVLKLLHACLQL